MSSDSEIEEERAWKGVAGTVILINGFDPLELETATTAYKAVCELFRSYLRRSSSQYIGVCFFGIKNTNSTAIGVENFFEIFPLSPPNLDEFKKLQDSTFEPANELKLSYVLRHCSKMFDNCKKLLSSRTLIILTRMDIPPEQADQSPALKAVEDLVESGIQIKIINVSQNSYRIDTFFENFLKEMHRGNEYKIPESVWDVNELKKIMYQHSHRHIALARLNFEIGQGISIGVGVFGLHQKQIKPKKIIADKETNQIVSTVTTQYKVRDNMDDLSMDVDVPQNQLLKSETLFYQNYGGKNIEITVDEKKQLHNPFGPPKMKLLGFKPAKTLCLEKWYLKGCQFLFPNESVIEGSTVAFKALHQACVEMSVIAICVLCTRVNSRPSIVALSPSAEPLGLDIKIGFDIIYIPFVENVRNVPSYEDLDESTAQQSSIRNIDAAQKIVIKNIIEGLTFDYKSDMFENPAVNSLLAAIEAIALEKEDMEDYKDTTKADPSKFQKINAELFEEMFSPFECTASKRQNTNPIGLGGKREKVENIDEELLESRLDQGQVEKYKVDELRSILRSKNIPNCPALTGLKKHDLVQLIYTHLGKENN